ncbi:hypothetical protein GCM10010284_10630 [Streptomyces rubiginosohelvolus]|nr:hypothetical protein GCM10010284_10630 [Streptomyces rubiginosohelvolus]
MGFPFSPVPRESRVRALRAADRVEVVAYPVPSTVVVRQARQQDRRCPTRPQDPGSRETPPADQAVVSQQ